MWTYETTRAGGYVTNSFEDSFAQSFIQDFGGTSTTASNTDYIHFSEVVGYGGGGRGGNTHYEEGHVTVAGPTSSQFTNVTRITEAEYDVDAGTSALIRYGSYRDESTTFNFTDEDESGTFPVGPFQAASTVSSTETANQSVESTSTITYSVPTSSTYSTTNDTTTSTEYPTTASTTVTDTIISSGFDTVTLTVTSTDTYSIGPNAVRDTVVVASSTDWLWSITASGTSLASAIGSSFTKATVSATETSSLIPVTIVSYNDDTGDPPFEEPTTYTDTYFDTSSTTSSVTTMMTSTYSTGISTSNGATIPFTEDTEVTINFVSSTDKDLTYNISSTSSFETGSPLYSDGSYAQEYTTTSSGRGTFITTTQLTSRQFYLVYVVGTSPSVGRTVGVTTHSVGLLVDAQASSNFPPDFIFNEAQPGPGFQAISAMGYGSPVGTNISGGDIPLSWGSAWPSIATPLLDSLSGTVIDSGSTVSTQYVPSDSVVYTTRSSMVGTDLSTYTGFFSIDANGSMETSTRTGVKTQDGSVIGGYGWYTGSDSFTTLTNSTGTTDSTLTSTYTGASGFPFPITFTSTSTYASSATQSWGVHRITKQNSLGSTTTSYISWADSLTTYSVKRSECIAFEPVAFANGSNKTVAFSAYPGN